MCGHLATPEVIKGRHASGHRDANTKAVSYRSIGYLWAHVEFVGVRLLVRHRPAVPPIPVRSQPGPSTDAAQLISAEILTSSRVGQVFQFQLAQGKPTCVNEQFIRD